MVYGRGTTHSAAQTIPMTPQCPSPGTHTSTGAVSWYFAQNAQALEPPTGTVRCRHVGALETAALSNPAAPRLRHDHASSHSATSLRPWARLR